MATRALSKPGSVSRSFLQDATFTTNDRLPEAAYESEAVGAPINDQLSPEEGERILPDSVNWVCLWRGDFPPIPIMFLCPTQVSAAWATWVRKELRDSDLRERLAASGMLPFLIASMNLHLYRDVIGLRHVVRRWSKSSHSFITNPREFTVTLADVRRIFQLPIGADIEIPTSSPDDPDDRSEAMIALILSRFILPGPFPDTISGHLFPMAIAIIRGERLPLALLVLAQLYTQLDLLSEDEVIGAGCLVLRRGCRPIYFKSSYCAATGLRRNRMSSCNEVSMTDAQGNRDPRLLNFVFSTTPSHLPSFINDNLEYVSYQPYQVLHQFGIDQTVPKAAKENLPLNTQSLLISRGLYLLGDGHLNSARCAASYDHANKGARNTPASPSLGEELLNSQSQGGTNDKRPTSPTVTSLTKGVWAAEVGCRGEASTLATLGVCSDLSWPAAGEGAPSGACSLSPHTIPERSSALPYFSRGDDGSCGANTRAADHVAGFPNNPLSASTDNFLSEDDQFSLRWESDVNTFLRSFDTALGFVLLELHRASLDEIDITLLLSWRDVCQEAEKLGCRVSPLLARIRKIACVLFKKHRKFVRMATLDIEISELESKLAALRKQKVDSYVSLPAECTTDIAEIRALKNLDDGLFI
ncbi:hypothetical protein L484_004993 [Morus notabilis]|uniref:Aminotransferase-like plant mobile domain-containing protein n=1 Tax=Morus notabilis TaxID=981085 RepID=W9SEK1_9ROSA|nr:hypothetical protein L484_004993 [Morus notabilis]